MTSSIRAGAPLWLIAEGWRGAAWRPRGARIAASNEDVAGPQPSPGATAGAGHASRPGCTHRSAARVPAALAHIRPCARVPSAWSSWTYRELTAPLDVAAPLAVRVLGRARPRSLSPVLVAWTLAEIVGAVAARRIVLTDAGDRRGSRARDRGPAVRAVVVAGTVLASVAGPAGHPHRAVGSLRPAWHLGRWGRSQSGRDDPIQLVVTVVASRSASRSSDCVLIGVVLRVARAAIWTVVEVAREGRSGAADPPTGSLARSTRVVLRRCGPWFWLLGAVPDGEVNHADDKDLRMHRGAAQRRRMAACPARRAAVPFWRPSDGRARVCQSSRPGRGPSSQPEMSPEPVVAASVAVATAEPVKPTTTRKRTPPPFLTGPKRRRPSRLRPPPANTPAPAPSAAASKPAPATAAAAPRPRSLRRRSPWRPRTAKLGRRRRPLRPRRLSAAAAGAPSKSAATTAAPAPDWRRRSRRPGRPEPAAVPAPSPAAVVSRTPNYAPTLAVAALQPGLRLTERGRRPSVPRSSRCSSRPRSPPCRRPRGPRSWRRLRSWSLGRISATSHPRPIRPTTACRRRAPIGRPRRRWHWPWGRR